MGASGRPDCGPIMATEAADFEIQYQQLCLALSKQGQVSDLTKEFNSMTSDESRIRFLLTLDCVCAPSRERPSKLKCAAESARLRAEGNAAYGRRGQEAAALELYTRAVLTAPAADPADDSLALALANRSAVLLSLGHLGPCLADMSRALQHGYPQRLHAKLEQRLQKLRQQALKDPALELPQTPDISRDFTEDEEDRLVSGRFRGKTAPTLDSVNPLLPSASEAVQVETVEGRGRCLTAARDIAPGEVLVVEEPYCAVVLPEENQQHCHHCCRWTPAPIGCLHCAEVRFCGRRCRAAAWDRYHAAECDIYGHLVSLDAGQMALLAVRSVVVTGWEGVMAARREDRSALPPEYRSDDYRRVRDLEGNVSARPAADLFKRALMAVLLGRLLAGSTLVPADVTSDAAADQQPREPLVMIAAELLRHLQTYPCNAHEVSEQVLPGGGLAGATTRQTGAAVLPALSLTNHACDPNVFRCYYGTTAVLRALRPLSRGEELCDNYGYHYALMPRDKRRAGLARQYYFTCQCAACAADLPGYQDIPSGPPQPVCRTCRGDVTTCGHVSDVAGYVAEVARAAGRLEEAVGEVLHGEASEEVRERVGELVAFLDKRVAVPWRGLNDAQEVFKMCFLIDGDVCPGD